MRSLALAAALFGSGFIAIQAIADDPATRRDETSRVTAPTTRVDVDERSGDTHVRIRVPDHAIDVDTQERHVRVRVPYFDGTVRW